MKHEFILEDKELIKYLEEVKTCFSLHAYKIKRKKLNLIYDYIRFYKSDFLGDAHGSFNYILEDTALLSSLGLNHFSNMENEYTYKGKYIYFELKLLEIESCVLKYKLSYMNTGICY